MAVAIRNYPQLECELVTDFTRLESIAPEWSKLWMASPHSEVFQSFGWARAAWKAFGDQMSLFAPVIHRGAEVIGIVPLVLKDGTLQMLGSPLSDYNEVICADEDIADVMTAAVDGLLRVRKHWQTCVLDNVPAQSRLARYLSGLQPSAKGQWRTAFSSPCPTIIFGSGPDVASKLMKKQSLRRHENGLKKLGDLKFSHVEDRKVVARHLSSFFSQHIARRAVLGEISHFLEERTRNMFQMLVEELDPSTLLRFAVLTLDDRPLAYHFGFEAKGKFVFYHPTFDIDYQKQAPGEVLMRQLFRYAQDRKLLEFDLTRGGETYKDRFATHIRENLTVHFNHDLGARRYIQMGIQRADGSVRKSLETLRKYPGAYGLARNAARNVLNLYRRERRRKQLEGAEYMSGAIRRAFRNCIFAGDATVAFLIGKQDVEYHAGLPGNGMSVRPAALSELAVVSAMNPDLTPSLSEFQHRLAAGQQPYLIRLGLEPVQIWCVHSRSTPAGEQKSRSEAPMLVLEQCWTAPWFRGGGLFRSMFQQVSGRGMEVLVRCRKRDQTTQEMHSLGFQALRKTMHLCFFHWFRPVVTFRGGLPKVSKAIESHEDLASQPEQHEPAEVESQVV